MRRYRLALPAEEEEEDSSPEGVVREEGGEKGFARVRVWRN